MRRIARSVRAAPLVAVAALAACEMQQREGEQTAGTEEVTEVAPTQETAAAETAAANGAATVGNAVMTSQFKPGPAAGDQPVTGEVRVLEGTQPNSFQVAARIEGLSRGEHAWHIHSAACGQKAPVVVAFTATRDRQGIGQPLVPGDAGVAEGTVQVPTERLTLDRLREGDYSVHVHEKGGIEHGPTVACADL